MLNLIAFLTNNKYWILHSYFIKWILILYGIKVGKNFYIEGVPKLKIKGSPFNIIIGNNVSVLGDIDIRNRESGKIIINDNTTIERDCRFVAARDGRIVIGKGSTITAFSIINGGGDIIIGKNCIFGPRLTMNANDHKTSRNELIKNQGFIHKSIIIEDDCWTGTNVSINKGVHIAKGSIIGSNAVVTKDTDEYSINVGMPAKKISNRD